MKLRNSKFLKKLEVSPAVGRTGCAPIADRRYRDTSRPVGPAFCMVLLYAAGAAVSFYLAYSSSFLSVLMLVYLVCLLPIAVLPTARQAFYTGLAAGLLCVAPQLRCFWGIFGPAAIVLWLILAFWIALFVLLAWVARKRVPARWLILLIPVIWTGLVVGGKEPARGGNFYNTAFVIGTNGEVVFRQAKSVPIQFFKDGLPAPEQKLWDSPWGPIGICICYDLSYTRVCDRLVRQGAKAIIVPTMDVADWGLRQHELHALVAPVRAAEYGIPIFRVASSGISQVLDRNGRELARAGFPGEGQIIRGHLDLYGLGSRPMDRWVAPACTWATGGICLWLLAWSRVRGFATRFEQNRRPVRQMFCNTK